MLNHKNKNEYVSFEAPQDVRRVLGQKRGAAWNGAICIVLYFLLLVTPLILMTVFRPRTDHPFIYELGKNFAILGYTALILQFVLSARLKRIEKPFGLDIVLQFRRGR